MNKQQAIEQVKNSFPSIWSKDDVLQLLEQLEESTPRPTDEQIKDITRYCISEIQDLGNEIVDFDSASFSIGYDNKIELDNIEISTDAIESAIEQVLKEYYSEKI